MSQTPRQQQIYSGRYEIVRPIARGGMAEVYLAHDQLLDRPVALKVLFPELSTDRNFVERFRREAQAAANLSHPNIVSIYDWGEEAGTYYIVMELVDGQPLSTVLRQEGYLLAERAAEFGAAVAAALAFAHRHGVVHRDVKPGNVLIDRSLHVKVADFGIARATNAQENLTQTGAVMGTATYFSPEQAQGLSVDPRSDVYSLGVVLYEMVTGQPPFTGENPVAVAYKHVSEQVPPPRSINANVPAQFEAIILQALAKNPDDRYPSAEELRADLLRFRQGRAVQAQPLPPVTRAVPAGVTQQATTAYPTTAAYPATTQGPVTTVAPAGVPVAEGPNRRTGSYIALLFAMLAALAVLLFLLGRELDIFGGSAGDTVAVPRVISETEAEARQILEAAGFDVKVEEENNEAEPGLVFAQDPLPDTQVEEGSEVTIKVSKGEAPIEVPSVLGDPVAEATRILEDLGFVVKTVPQADDNADPGDVLAQDPAGGEEAPRGSEVTLTVASGKTKVPVPDVRGQDEDSARDEIFNAGLKVRTTSETSPTVPDGRVIRSDPPQGSQVEKGSTVTIVVSTGPEPVPNVEGLTEREATNRLSSAGYKFNVRKQRVFTADDDGKVIDQDPAAGTKAPAGSTVTITVGQFQGAPTSTTEAD